MHRSEHGPVVHDATDRVYDRPAAQIIVYTEAWAVDRPADDDHPANAQVHSRIVVNGQEIPGACGIEVDASGGDFVVAKVGLLVADIKFVPLTQEEFSKPDLSTHAAAVARVKVYEDKAGETRWTAYAENGEPVADSGEGYRNREHALTMVRDLFPAAEVEAVPPNA